MSDELLSDDLIIYSNKVSKLCVNKVNSFYSMWHLSNGNFIKSYKDSLTLFDKKNNEEIKVLSKQSIQTTLDTCNSIKFKCLTLDKHDNIYIYEINNEIVLKLSPQLDIITSFPIKDRIQRGLVFNEVVNCMACHNQYLYALSFTCKIKVFDCSNGHNNKLIGLIEVESKALILSIAIYNNIMCIATKFAIFFYHLISPVSIRYKCHNDKFTNIRSVCVMDGEFYVTCDDQLILIFDKNGSFIMQSNKHI